MMGVFIFLLLLFAACACFALAVSSTPEPYNPGAWGCKHLVHETPHEKQERIQANRRMVEIRHAIWCRKYSRDEVNNRTKEVEQE